jgi:hypothetical protein
MQGNKIKKRPLKPSKKPLTSTSSSQSATARGDLAFSVEQKKSKGEEYMILSIHVYADGVRSHDVQSTPYDFVAV